MDLQLAGKHVLISGASRGIGFACAQGFLREGARVGIVGRSQANLDTALDLLRAEAGEVRGYRADLTDAAAAALVLDRAQDVCGPIDVLVNCAGAALRTPFNELSPQAWQNAMQAKFFPYIYLIDPLIKRMAERKSGAIVNVIGMGGKMASTSHLAGGAANAALMLATAGLAAAYGPSGVRVNAVNPSLTMTDRLQAGLAVEARLHNVSEEEMMRRAHARAPLGRLAEPEEIANAVIFLSSPRASYISGALLSMDGAAVPIVV
jgi:NAD(P)-dependent dehydrogenase (short-subunit alcohol dehydrogenase family)